MSIINDRQQLLAKQTAETTAVLQSHLAAFRLGDVDLTLRDYSSNAILINGTGSAITGLKAIREAFVVTYRDFFPEGTRDMTIDEQTVYGEIAYIRWRTSNTIMATDTFIVRKKKIVVQTVAVQLA